MIGNSLSRRLDRWSSILPPQISLGLIPVDVEGLSPADAGLLDFISCSHNESVTIHPSAVRRLLRAGAVNLAAAGPAIEATIAADGEHHCVALTPTQRGAKSETMALVVPESE